MLITINGYQFRILTDDIASTQKAEIAQKHLAGALKNLEEFDCPDDTRRIYEGLVSFERGERDQLPVGASILIRSALRVAELDAGAALHLIPISKPEDRKQ